MHNNLNLPGSIDPDKLVAGRYRLRQFLGKGSFGQVYYAEDTKFEPPRGIALKLLHPQYTADSQVREDLRREASVLARFNHPNILEVLDFGITDEIAFIVTKLADGGSLAQKLRPDPTRPPVRMPFNEAAQYLEQIADGLDEAHAQGLVHRDIKPQNILLDRRGRPLIADFGLAAAVSSSSSSALVDAGTSGTALYMAPEQWQGRAGRASDIYALGVMLYQMLTGVPPFTGSQLELMGQHLSTPAPSLSYRAPDLKYPAALDEVIFAVLSKDSRARPRPAKELSRLFRAALESPTSPRPTPQKPPPVNELTQPLPPRSAELPNTLRKAASTTPASAASTVSKKKRRLPVSLIVGVEAIALVVIATIVFLVLTGNNSSGRTNTAVSQANSAATSTSLPATTQAIVPTATNPVPTTVLPTATNLPLPTTVPATTPPIADLQAVPPTASEPVVPSPTPVPPTLIATRPPPSATPVPPTPVPAGDPKVVVQAPVVLAGHSDRVIAVAFSPDGKLLASGSFDTLVKLWNVETGKEVRTLRGHTAGVRSVAFSPDGKILASSGNDSVIKLWDVSSGNQIQTLRGHTAEIGAVAFSPDGTLLVSGSDDHNLKIWEVASGKELKTLTGHSREVNAVAFSPDGKTVASGSFDNTIKLWDVGQGTEIRTFNGHQDQVFSVAFSPDGKTLASSSVDRTVKLWEVDTGKELKTLTGHTDEVPAVAFSSDGKIVASGGGNADNSVRLWEVATGKILKILPGHSSGIRGLAFSPDGTTLASASRDNTIRLWRITL